MTQYEELLEQMEQVLTLLDTAQALNTTMDPQDVLEMILKQAAETLNAEAGTLWILNEDDQTISARAVIGPSASAIMGLTLNKNDGIVGDVIRTGETVLIEDVLQDKRWSSRIDAESGFVTSSMLTVPLKVKTQQLGALQLLNKQGSRYFNEQDRRLATALANHSALALHNSQMYSQLYQFFISLVKTLARVLDARDPYTAGHSERVSRYSLMIAEGLHLSKEDKKELERAALLHDIGKLGIPDQVLGKTTGLTDTEYDLIKTHTTIGADILRTIEPKKLIAHSVQVALMHHERLNGSGYPNGLTDLQIPLFARIVGIADSFDAMTTDRPYKKGATYEEGLEELARCKGSHYDSQLVDVFIDEFKKQNSSFVTLGC